MPLVQVPQVVKPLQEKAVQPAINSYPEYGYSHYSTIILSIASFRYCYLTELPKILKDFKLGPENEEVLFDWLITESLSKTLSLVAQAKVSQHYRHDVYKCIYDFIGHVAEHTILQQFKTHQLQFLKGQTVKVLVAGDNLIISRGVIPNA